MNQFGSLLRIWLLLNLDAVADTSATNSTDTKSQSDYWLLESLRVPAAGPNETEPTDGSWHSGLTEEGRRKHSRKSRASRKMRLDEESLILTAGGETNQCSRLDLMMRDQG